MKFFRFTLLSDGSSDKALIPHLEWLLKQNGLKLPVVSQWADLSRLREKPRNLAERIQRSIELYPCDLLFVHRDAERENPINREQEIVAAQTSINGELKTPFICVIPVRMQEAWLLFDESAVRRASGNPHGSVRVNLPSLRNTENLPNPKKILHQALKAASEKTGRRLKQFPVHHSASQVSQYIEDFSSLRNLSAFQKLETDIKDFISNNQEKG